MIKALFYIVLGMFIYWVYTSDTSDEWAADMKGAFCEDYKPSIKPAKRITP